MALTKVSTPGIKDEAITLAKLLHGDSNSNGKFLRANNGADPTFEAISIPASINNLVEDTSPQLGGNLDTNSRDILFSDNASAKFGASTDLEIYHDPNNNHSYITDGNGSGRLIIKTNYLEVDNAAGDEAMIEAIQDGAVNLYYNGSKKFETTANGIKLGSLLDINPSTYTEIQDNSAYGLNIKHMNSKPISIATGGDYIQIYNLTSSEMYLKCLKDAAVELYYNGGKKLETTNAGFALKEGSTTRLSFEYSNSLAFITANAGNEIKVSCGNGDANGIEFWDYTGVNKRCQIDGHGIKFNADTAQANALDDYEEGTFTALLQTQSGSPGFSTTTGRYTKIGRMVHIHAEIFWNAANGSGNANIYIPLPFNVTSAGRGGFAIGLVSGLDCDAGHFPLVLPEIGAGYAWLLQYKGDDPAGGHSHMVASDMRNYSSRAFSFGGTYTTD